MAIMGITLVVASLAVVVNLKSTSMRKKELEYQIREETLEKQKAEGVTRRLVGFRMIDRGIPRHGYEIAAPDGTRIGHVTSGTMSPCMKVGFGLGYVTPEYAKAGTEIAVVVREKPLRAEVVKIPFV